MKYLIIALMTMTLAGTAAAQQQPCCNDPQCQDKPFDYTADRFADIEVLRYQVPGFDQLSLNQKMLVYYLTEAALWGRDIMWDQNYKYNLPIRRLLEGIYEAYDGPRDAPYYQAFEKCLKQVEFGNGIHHHYSMDQFTPGMPRQWMEEMAGKVPAYGLNDVPVVTLLDIIYNPQPLKRVNQADGADLVLTSACNLYEGVNQKEVEDYYAAIKDTTDLTPISYGLNARVVKRDGKVAEEIYKQGGLYGPAIDRIIANLTLALPYAENVQQKAIIEALIDYYRTGDLRKWDEYSILWAEDTKSPVDFINGFIENYGDPLGMTGAWESIVNFKDEAASHRTEVLSQNAQWFEDHSPIDPDFRKPEVKGVSAKVITAAILAGDAYPATPIGINLPNPNWIRAQHGSKSVTIENITRAYDEASHGNGFNEEFVIDEPTRQLLDKHLFQADNLHTDLHECLGHGSGRLLPGVDPKAMKAYKSTIEETRADLFGLYYLADPKLVELGIISDPDTYKAEYYKYMLNGLMTQLMRIEPGKDIEESHMRNRQLIAAWVLEKGQPQGVVELVQRGGKTYVQVNDYEGLRQLFGQLLKEVQRITSTGDYEAGRALVERYAVKVDPRLHQEVIERYSHLDIAPYKGFVNPTYRLVTDAQGQPVDVEVLYGEGYLPQMLRYSRDYSPLTR